MDTPMGWDFQNTVYPGTNVLVNHLGIRDGERLDQVEDKLAAYQMRALRSGAGYVTPSYDLRAWEDVHRHLFSDLYAWAGQSRTVDRPVETLNGQELFFAPHQEMAERMQRLVEDVVRDPSQDWAAMGEDEVAEQLGAVYTEAFHVRPFREGNTRSLMAFTDRIAESTRYQINWERLHPAAWEYATMDAMPHQVGGRPDPRPFVETIGSSLEPRPDKPRPLLGPPSRDTLGGMSRVSGGPSRDPVSDREAVAPSAPVRDQEPALMQRIAEMQKRTETLVEQITRRKDPASGSQEPAPERRSEEDELRQSMKPTRPQGQERGGPTGRQTDQRRADSRRADRYRNDPRREGPSM